VLIAGLWGCQDKGSQPPINPPQIEPGTPYNPWPPNSATGLGMNIDFSWECENPENSQTSFAVFWGRDTLHQISLPFDGKFLRSSWRLRREACEMLFRIYTMQMAYRARYNAYALNGITASAASPTSFDEIGVTILPDDKYVYAMVAAANTFSCAATANLELGAALDFITVDETGLIDTISSDYRVPFSPGMTYYWQIVSYFDTDKTIIGPIWNFTTSADSGITNNAPVPPTISIPSDGITTVGPIVIFTWRCSDPEHNLLAYDFYLAVGETPSLQQEYLFEPIIASDWRKQQVVLSQLREIAAGQISYRDAFGSYWAVDRGASFENQPDGFSDLGVILNSDDCYYYHMIGGIDTFSCSAMANIDRDGDYDQWAINHNSIITHVDDADVPFLESTQYSWKIVARDSHGSETESSIWHFTTVSDTSFLN
jgi:hypothetical protein